VPGAADTIPTKSDRECLEAWRRERKAENLRPIVERYLGLVFSSASRQTGNADEAAEVTRAVFLVLARRSRKVGKNTVLAAWLFELTRVACRNRISLLRRFAGWFRYKRRYVANPNEPLWTRVAPVIDRAVQRLRGKQRNVMLLRGFLNYDVATAAAMLRSSVPRVEKQFTRGMRKLARRLHTRRAPVDAAALTAACATEGSAISDGLAPDILEAIEAARGGRSRLKIARRTLRSLFWGRWRRRLAIGLPLVGLLVAIAGVTAWWLDRPTGYSRLLSTFIVWSVRLEARRMAGNPRPWPSDSAALRLDGTTVRHAGDIYQGTNIWLAHLHFTREQWRALDAKYIGTMPNFLKRDGMPLLRNPKAQRSGINGVLGYEFDWSRGDFDFAGAGFSNVAVRVKGNLGSLCTPKPSFKVDLNKIVKGQKLGGVDELTFNNLYWDYSCLNEALGYQFYRDAGVPAPRTAYAWLTATVEGKWERKPLGLYLMVEQVGDEFAKERFGSKKTPIFKPVTYDLFKHLGDAWSSYAAIYDLKTEATEKQLRRVVEFAELVSSASDEKFAVEAGELLDLNEFAQFLASHVLLSSYDSILADGQNFYMYLHPRSNKFGFIPWDLDAAWGNFWIASKRELERASIWHPWAGENRFIERVMGLEEFQRLYRRHLEDLLTRVFVPERLLGRIDEMAAVLRRPVAAESQFRLDKFEQALGLDVPSDEAGMDGHRLKRFINARARSVRRQLDGQSKGMVVKYRRGG
jgi:DNA-directed RNA polymerase specialized sigma24 family protein